MSLGSSYRDMVPTPGTAAAYLVGAVWLLAAVAFVGAGVLVLTRRPFWSVVAIAAVVASVPVLALNPSRNVAGLVMDGLVVAVAIATWTISRTRERRAI